MDITPLPFEYETRYGDQYRDWGIPIEQAAPLEDRDRQLEDYLAKTVTPLIFHWSGAVADLVGARNGPGWFNGAGNLGVVYRFDTAASVTVKWEVGGAVVDTHTFSSDNENVIAGGFTRDQIIMATVTANSGAKGLTAFVFLR